MKGTTKRISNSGFLQLSRSEPGPVVWPETANDGSLTSKASAGAPKKREEARLRSASCQKIPRIRRKRSFDLFFSHFKELTKELSLVKRQNESLKKRYVEIEAHMKGSSGTEIIVEKQGVIEGLRTQIRRVEEEGRTLEIRCRALKQEYVQLQQISSAQLGKVFDALHEKVSSAEAGLVRAEEENSRLEKLRAEASKRKGRLEAENEVLGAEIIRAVNEIKEESEDKQKLEGIEEKLEVQASELFSLQAEVVATESHTLQLEAERKVTRERIEQYAKMAELLLQKQEECRHHVEMSREIYLVREQENATLRSIYEKVSNSLQECMADNRDTGLKQDVIMTQCRRFVDLYHGELQEARARIEKLQQDQLKFNMTIKSINKAMKESKRKRWKKTRGMSTADSRTDRMGSSEAMSRTGSISLIDPFPSSDADAMERHFHNALRFI